MHEQVTLLRPGASSRGAARGSLSSFPPELLEEVRGRLRLLAGILLVAFSFEPLTYFGSWILATLGGVPTPPGAYERNAFQLLYVSTAMASALLFWAAGRRRVSAARLMTLGSLYEIVICFFIAFTSTWEHYLRNHTLPNLTWVPVVVVLFPLIVPGPQARMLAATVTAAAMAPFALLVLSLLGKVEASVQGYIEAALASLFAVAAATLGARIVYRLGKAVTAALELGSYRLEELLGEGGMGEVWRARHRMLARPAAIKLIRRSLTAGAEGGVSQEAMQRFEREAQAIARLRSPHTVNPRVDIYAMGCVAYWLVTGHLVFSGDSAMALLLHHARTPPSPPSSRTELPISPALDAVIMACLAKDPSERPQSARELLRRLEAAEGSSPWTEERARDWWSRHHPLPQRG